MGPTNSAICEALPSAIPTLRSSRSFRAAENATAISAAPPTSATTIKPTNAWLLPNVFRRLLDRLNKNLAHQGHEHRDNGQRDQSQTHGPRRFACLAAFCAGKDFAVR